MNPQSTAVFSPCRLYRYELWRHWNDDLFDAPSSTCVFIGLNPSTADELNDDPTIRRCIAYAKKWGHGSLCMLNLFAFRATLPANMKAASDPIGPQNDSTLKRITANAGIVIAAWGNHGSHLRRDQTVISMLPNLHCLKTNDNGSPVHPLYQPKGLMPIRFPSHEP